MYQSVSDAPCVNLDWVAFSILLVPSPHEKDDHKFTLNDISSLGFKVIEYVGTNIYSRRAIVFAGDGQKLLTLLFQPHSRIIDFKSCLVEVANPLLYSRYLQFDGKWYGGLLWVPELLQALHPYTFQCLSRIDIAADFPLTSERATKVRQLSSDAVYVQRYTEGVSFHNYVTIKGAKVTRIPRQLSWGSKNSNIKWKLYNKSLEVFEYEKVGDKVVQHCNKQYIVDKWLECGWDVNNVWRLEVSICPMEKYKFHGRTLRFHDLANWFTISDIFTCLYQTKFVCRMNEGHADRSNDTRVYLLGNLGSTDKLQIRESVGDVPVMEYVNGLRSAMAQLQKPEVIVNKQMRKLWIQTAMQVTRVGNLQAYFNNTYGYPVEKLPAIASIINPPIQ